MYVCLCVTKIYGGIQSANTLVSGSGPDIPLIQDIKPSNSRARLSHATLRFVSLAKQSDPQNFYRWYFKSDFDAVKTNFDLLIEYIKKTT